MVESGAEFSPCGQYRRTLWRRWGTGNHILNGLLCNPSKASADRSDPTVTRFCERAKRMEFYGLIITNLFDLVSTDITGLLRHNKPCSDENDLDITETALMASMVVCGWGNASPLIPERAAHVTRMLRARSVKLYALKILKDGQPTHPLYRPYSETPFEWKL
jgi:hypothetical protein